MPIEIYSIDQQINSIKSFGDSVKQFGLKGQSGLKNYKEKSALRQVT